jgi:hypothetical protein
MFLSSYPLNLRSLLLADSAEVTMVSSDHFRQELVAQMSRASGRGATHILINARDLHCSLGDFLGVNDEMIQCRVAMQAEMTIGDVLIITASPAARMTVRYALPCVS